jgi:mitogen-activated protein kinase kinase kinase
MVGQAQSMQHTPTRPEASAIAGVYKHRKPALRRHRKRLIWKRGELIGEGTCGRVYKGLNEGTGELIAVKQICLADGTDDDVAALRREIKVMRQLHHHHVVRYIGTDISDRYLFIFLEYVPGGSIASLLKTFGSFSEDLIRKFTYQV